MFPPVGVGEPGWLVDGGVHAVSVSLFLDVVHALDDEPLLLGAEDGPDVRLLWGAVAFFKAPLLGDVLVQLRVVDGVGPDLLEGELRPVLDLDRLDLCPEEELLLLLYQVQEEVDRRVLVIHQVHLLQGATRVRM